jgi:dihydrofolate reductase
MQRVTYYIATSVDGFIARADGRIDFFLAAGDHIPAYLEALRGFDAVVMGRATYELGLAHGVTDPYPWLESYVVSRTLASPDPMVTVVADPILLVRSLAARPGRGVYLCGGGALAGALLDAGLVDEVVLKINPVLVGAGKPMVPALARDVPLALVDSHAHASGVVVLRYRVTR